VGRIRVNRVIRARIGYFAGALVIALGLLLMAGPGPALVVVGVAIIVAFVWLYDVDEPEQAVPESQIRRRVGDDW
jgi:hypothetical protein